MGWGGVKHLSIAADPATHSKKEVLAGLLYSWECGIAAHGDLQFIPERRLVLASDVEMPEHIAALSADRRMECQSAFRQWQAISNMVAGIGQWSGEDDFFLGEDVRLQPVHANEVPIDLASRAYIVNRDTHGKQPVLPDEALASAQRHNLLVVSLDQGSVGTTGYAYAESVGMMVQCRWDKYHRLMRDIQLSLSGVKGDIS